MNVGRDPRPFLGKELLSFALQQKIASARVDEHPAASLGLDELLVDELLVALENRQWIDAKFRSDRAHGRQGVTLLEHAVQDHGDDSVAKLAVNRLTVVPLMVRHG